MPKPTTSEKDHQWNFYGNDKWPYDLFMRTYILKTMEFCFVSEHYDRPIKEFHYPVKMLEIMLSTLPRRPEGIAWFTTILDEIEKAGLQTVFQFINNVATRRQAEGFLQRTGISLPYLMGVLDFFKQWWFPFGAQLRQLVEDSDQHLIGPLACLKQQGYAQGFKLLDIGRTCEGRRTLSEQTGIPEEILLDLVNRADVTRIPYVSGATVKRMWAIGYDSLQKLQKTSPMEYFSRVSQYYASMQKPIPFDAKLEYIRNSLSSAQRMPVVVEE